MIPFDEIDSRLERLGKNRAWLAEAAARRPDSIGAALAPNAPERKRSKLLQKALSDAIEREEERQAQKAVGPVAPDENLIRICFTDADFAVIESAAGIVQTPIKDFIARAAVHQARAEMEKRASRLTPVANHQPSLAYFPEIPLLHAAAGAAIDAHAETWQPTLALGPGRFAVQLHGDSMAPRYPDGSIVILRERESLKVPVLKKGQIYLFVAGGEKTLKVYQTRVATPAEIEAGLSYVSPRDGKTKVPVLRSLNPAYPEIVAKEPIEWLGYLDPKDNQP